jgi:two-component system sensor histidine kinase KdpD
VRAYALALLGIAVATGVSFAIFPIVDLANIIMVYLLAVVLVATRLGAGPAITATVGGVAVFVSLFLPHYYPFVLSDLRYLPTFTVMLLVGLIVSTLTSRLRAEVLATQERELRSSALYQLSRGLAAAESRTAISDVLRKHVLDVFGCPAYILEVSAAGNLDPIATRTGDLPLDVAAVALAQRALRERTPRSSGLAAASTESFLFLPMIVANHPVGLLCVQGITPHYLSSVPHLRLLDAFANNAAIALQRLVVGDEARRSQQRIDQERLRNTLLSSMSHDFRTPLASITGAITTLIDNERDLDAATRRELMHSVRDDAESLERQVRNLLDLTKLESGNLQIRREWHPLDEVVGCAMTRVERTLRARKVGIDLAPDLPLVAIDARLVEQLLVNLLENAARHTPPGSPIDIGAERHEQCVRITVADRGPGIPTGEHERVFTKFYRLHAGKEQTGVGLGLAICRAIATLHDAHIWVDDRDGGGAVFVVELPIGGEPPIGHGEPLTVQPGANL